MHVATHVMDHTEWDGHQDVVAFLIVDEVVLIDQRESFGGLHKHLAVEVACGRRDHHCGSTATNGVDGLVGPLPASFLENAVPLGAQMEVVVSSSLLERGPSTRTVGRSDSTGGRCHGGQGLGAAVFVEVIQDFTQQGHPFGRSKVFQDQTVEGPLAVFQMNVVVELVIKKFLGS